MRTLSRPAPRGTVPYRIGAAPEELSRVRQRHPSFHYASSCPVFVGPAWWGDVRPRRRIYRLEIRYLDPLGRPFPNRPHVFVPFLFPRLPNPHGLEDHSLCLDFPNDHSTRRWIPKDGIETLIDWSAIWLFTYELWLTSALMDKDRVWLHPAV